MRDLMNTFRFPNSNKILMHLVILDFQKLRIFTPFCDAGKAKKKFRLRFNNNKSKQRSFRKGKQNVPQKRFHSHYIQDCHRSIDDWEVTLFDKCETHKQILKRETFW